jgi:hypothetical protein
MAFKRKAFVKWLDTLAKTIAKERDGWTCQYDGCGKVVSGKDCHAHHIKTCKYYYLRWDLINLLTLCSHHHTTKFHEGIEGGVWFDKTYPARHKHIIEKPIEISTWKERDFVAVQEYLVGKAIDFKVDPYRIKNETYRNRLIKLIGETL